jgi:hypothetical protein
MSTFQNFQGWFSGMGSNPHPPVQPTNPPSYYHGERSGAGSLLFQPTSANSSANQGIAQAGSNQEYANGAAPPSDASHRAAPAEREVHQVAYVQPGQPPQYPYSAAGPLPLTKETERQPAARGVCK